MCIIILFQVSRISKSKASQTVYSQKIKMGQTFVNIKRFKDYNNNDDFVTVFPSLVMVLLTKQGCEVILKYYM